MCSFYPLSPLILCLRVFKASQSYTERRELELKKGFGVTGIKLGTGTLRTDEGCALANCATLSPYNCPFIFFFL